MRKARTILMTAAVATVAGCGLGTGGGDQGPNVQRNYELGAFEQIHVAGPHEVRVKTGSDASVVASGPERAIERLTVEVEENRLVIQTRQRQGMFDWGRRGGTVTIDVTVPQLSAASLAGSGNIVINRVSGNRFTGAIAGSGDLTVDQMEVETMTLAVAGSGDLLVRSGQARSAQINIAGSGDVDSQGVRTESAKISIAGSGDIKANATGTADVSIMGSGDVRVSGGARCNVKKSGSGDVRCS